jgi:predicted RNA-binding protein with PUA-like domain
MRVAKWLLKTEPSTYSWDDLVRDKRTTWDGVANPTALKNIRSMKKGDLAFIYHTGDEKPPSPSRRSHRIPIPIRRTRPARRPSST